MGKETQSNGWTPPDINKEIVTLGGRKATVYLERKKKLVYALILQIMLLHNTRHFTKILDIKHCLEAILYVVNATETTKDATTC